MSRLRKVLADDIDNPGESVKATEPIKTIESNPDHGKVIWSLLNKNQMGGYISYNTTTQIFYGFVVMGVKDLAGQQKPLVNLKLNKKNLKDQFENIRGKLITKSDYLNTKDFTPKEIVSLDSLIRKKSKRPDEEKAQPGNPTPSIEQMITRYFPNKRESGEQAGHIYGIYFFKDTMTMMAMNIDSNGGIVSQEILEPGKDQDCFNKVEQGLIDAMSDDAPYYNRDVDNSPQSFGLNIDVVTSPWQKFDVKQDKEKEKDEKEKEKREKENPVEEPPAEPKEQEQPEQKQEQPTKQPEDQKNPSKKVKKKKTDVRNVGFGGTTTAEFIFKGKDLDAINKLVRKLKDKSLSPASDILPYYQTEENKEATMSLSRILTALNIFKKLVNVPLKKTAGIVKTSIFARRSRLRKLAYVYTQILNQLSSELVNNLQGTSVSSVYFTQETEDASNASACGFIIQNESKFVAFGPQADNDIVTIDTDVITEMRQADEAADVNQPKISINDFMIRVQKSNVDNIKVFSNIEDAEKWIQKVNNDNVKGRVVLNNAQLGNDGEWMGQGENPDLKPEDLDPSKKEKEPKQEEDKKDDKKEEPKKTKEQIWDELPAAERTWKLRLTYKKQSNTIDIIREWVGEYPNVIINKSALAPILV